MRTFLPALILASIAALGLLVAPALAGESPAQFNAASGKTGKPTASLLGIQQFTVADLQAALDDANAQTPPDTRHGACWQALIPWAQQSLNNPLPTGLGLAQLAQKSFDLQAKLSKPLFDDATVSACALTVYDLKIDFAKLAGLVGVGVALPIKLPF